MTKWMSCGGSGRTGSRRRGLRSTVTAAAHLGAVAVGMTTILGCNFATPALATVTHHRSCDAACAELTVHRPANATSVSVHWKRYPYASQVNPDAIDRWGSTERQCTGYATWALNVMGVDFGVTDRARNGRTVTFLSASSWAKAARRGGWTVSRKPVVGAVAQWNANETSYWRVRGVSESASAGPNGHVGIVTKVYRDGTVLVSQYNASRPARSYSSLRTRAPRYLYIGVK
jgi:surface antigen